MTYSWKYASDDSVIRMVVQKERLTALLPEATALVAKRNKWRYRQVIAAVKAAMHGSSIGWQVAVARRAGYGF